MTNVVEPSSAPLRGAPLWPLSVAGGTLTNSAVPALTLSLDSFFAK